MIIRRYFWSFCAFTGVFLLCILPFPDVPQLGDVPLMDKWVHFVMFGGLSCVIWWDYAHDKKKKGTNTVSFCQFLVLVGVPMLFGGLMELAQQYLTTYRSGDWMDFVADCVGVILAIPIGLFLLRTISSKGNKGDS